MKLNLRLPVIPKTWANLRSFADWYIANGCPIRVPARSFIYAADVSYSVCLFRHDVYQVEMYLAKPHCYVPRHSHPFEQMIVILGGDLTAMRGPDGSDEPSQVSRVCAVEDIPQGWHPDAAHPDAGTIGQIQPVGDWHEITGYDQGFVFLNFQRWPSREMMDSAVVHYQNGPSLGPMHDELLKTHLK